MQAKQQRSRFRFAGFADLRIYLARSDQFNGAVVRGTWTPGQILYHLAAAVELSCRPRAAGEKRQSRLSKWPMRLIVLRLGIPRGRAMPSQLRDALSPPPDADVASQLLRLLQAIDVFENVQHELPSHPVLGDLTHDEWRQFHLRHCELHLRHFVMP